MLRIRTMNADDMSFAIRLAADEGWNPGLHDGVAFFAADCDGFLLGEINGRPVGCISAVSYGGRFGFIGLYIMVPEMRGRGQGMRLWDAAMARLAGHNIGLDGVVEQQDNYRKSGFELHHRNIRFRSGNRSLEGGAETSVVRFDPSMHDALSDYDGLCFPESRRAFLDGWLSMPESQCLVWRDGERLRGYGVIRKCREGHKIGPLFADDAAIAEALFDRLCQAAGAMESVYLDVPETNRAAVDFAERRGMDTVFETARMYTGDPPGFDLSRVFGITTFELG